LPLKITIVLLHQLPKTYLKILEHKITRPTPITEARLFFRFCIVGNSC
jgi:hypothetical protein